MCMTTSSSMTLKAKLWITTTAAIILLVGVSEWLSYRQTAAFLDSHEAVMRQGAGPEALSELRANKQRLFVHLAATRVFNAAITIGALAVVLNALWYRLVLAPIGLLLGHINRMSRGTWTGHIPVARRDEIGQLTEAFNQLGDQLTLTIHQFATASKLSAIALVTQRIARGAEIAQIRLLGIANMLRRARPADGVPEPVFEDLEVVAASLKEIQRHAETEFDTQFRLHAAVPVPPSEDRHDQVPQSEPGARMAS